MHRHNDYVCVAFYTLATPYEGLVDVLRNDCKKFNIPFTARGYPTTGSWVRNAGLKPLFVLEMLDQYPNSNILYLDVDARIRQRPALFDNFDGDVGVHYRRGQELLSGTIFLRSCPEVRKLVSEWLKLQEASPTVWDQKTLSLAINSSKKLKVVKLPPSYTQIFDSMKHHGDPVIEHMQASRKFKKVINQMIERKKIPPLIGRVRIREASDGSLYITRHDPKAIAYLDKNAIRLPGQLRWYPVFDSQKKIEDLKSIFTNKNCYIVGKGPSLDHLRREHFPDPNQPVIALNEAIHQVDKLKLENPVFGLQQDAKLRSKCLPKNGRLFVSIKAANFYSKEANIYVFDSRHYKLSLNALSVSTAISITKSLGCTGFDLLCFDACVNKKLSYAKCIECDSIWGGKPERFLTHRAKIEARAGGLPLTFVIPKDLAVASCDKSQR